MEFSQRNVYISGGTSGIGLAAGELFASLGANIYVFSVDPEEKRRDALAALQKAAGTPGQRFEAVALDVTDHLAVDATLRAAAESFGAPYVLINSAGIGGAVYFEELSYERFDKTVQISLYGARNACAALIPYMKKDGGYVVNVSSMSGLIGLIGYAAYASAKFGMVGLSMALRSEYKKYGIKVAAFCPPQVDTPLLRETDKTKPPEVKAINNNAGVLTPAEAAQGLLIGMKKDQPIIVPGTKGALFYHFNRLFPRIRERMTDRVIRRVQQQMKD